MGLPQCNSGPVASRGAFIREEIWMGDLEDNSPTLNTNLSMGNASSIFSHPEQELEI